MIIATYADSVKAGINRTYQEQIRAGIIRKWGSTPPTSGNGAILQHPQKGVVNTTADVPGFDVTDADL